MKNKAWILFAAIGGIFAYWGIHQLFIIPASSGEQWDWLIPTPDLIEYIHFRFRQLGTITLANGVFILGVTLTSFRRDEHWAWGALTVVPVYFLLLTVVFYWLFFVTVPLALLAGWALWATRAEKPVVTNPRGPGWMLVFFVGLLFLYFAYDNLFVIPALDVRDPERGWDWLTIDPAHIDYIKLYFRVYGIHVFAFSLITLSTTFFGLKEGYRSAWQILWLAPSLVIVHIFFWPWLTALLIGVTVLAGIGLWLAQPNPVETQNGN